MLIKVLSENTSVSDAYAHEHGLSVYVETGDKKVLFDVGAGELFLENARKMDVDIADVDVLIISHGHYDHGGGLRTFLKENEKAKVFLHPLAFQNYYVSKREEDEYIGLDQALKDNPRIVFTCENYVIGDGLQTFSQVVQKYPLPASNKTLLMEANGGRVPDSFSHEQSLIVEEEGVTLLLTGCSHNGIRNILEHFYHLKGRMPDVSIGGFHLSTTSGAHDSLESIDALSQYLLTTGTIFYTGHCTGIVPYERLKENMADRIHYLPAGSVLGL